MMITQLGLVFLVLISFEIFNFFNFKKLIKENIDNLYSLKATHSKMRVQEPDKFENLCKSQCSFLYTHYTLIYNKAFNDELVYFFERKP